MFSLNYFIFYQLENNLLSLIIANILLHVSIQLLFIRFNMIFTLEQQRLQFIHVEYDKLMPLDVERSLIEQNDQVIISLDVVINISYHS